MPELYRRPIRRSPKSDPQQYRVYRMEVEAIGARRYMRLPRSSIRALIKSISRAYGVPVPQVRWRDLGRWAAEWSAGVITFSTRKKMARDFLTVTHEMAHHLHECLSVGLKTPQQAHGPEFMACHMSILDTCRMIPVEGMRAICKTWGVRYLDPGTKNSLTKLGRIVRGSHST